MLRIEVTHHKGRPTSIAADFDEMGGTIGRSEESTLVLSDENRHISRTQASISYRSGIYTLQDQGSGMPTLVNGQPVGSGSHVSLRNGDEIQIGEYKMRAKLPASSAAAPAMPDDPFADLAPAPLSPAPQVGSPRRAQKSPNDPFASPGSNGLNANSSTAKIPDDFDPFADLALPENSQAVKADSSVQAKEFSVDPTPTVDEIFKLGIPDSWDPLAPQDPVSSSRKGHQIGSDNDLLADLSPQRAPLRDRTPVQRDDAPILSAAFRPPRAERPDEAPPTEELAKDAANETPVKRTVVSWDTEASPALDKSGEIKSTVLSSPRRPPQSSPQELQLPAGSRPSPAPAAHVFHPNTQSTGQLQRGGPPIASGMTAQRYSTEPGELIRAFFDGCGLTDARLGPVTPELMQILGRLVHEAIRGTLDLLLARALTKREVRAQPTVLIARENNPLKFSPNVEAALSNLLAPPSQGFMAPVDAMRNAYNDLRSHEIAMLAGLRAALNAVLARFDPAQLEKRLSQRGVVSGFLPQSHNAKLWQLYEDLYSTIAKEAESDFHALFGQEFVRAYEAQIEKLEQADADRGL